MVADPRGMVVGQREVAIATSMAGDQGRIGRNVRGGAGGVEEEWRSSRSGVIEGERGRIDEDSRHGSR